VNHMGVACWLPFGLQNRSCGSSILSTYAKYFLSQAKKKEKDLTKAAGAAIVESIAIPILQDKSRVALRKDGGMVSLA
jgi:hypothetical protein